jgi:hypothetical protein
MPTYDLIASYTLPSAANSYTFSSIPSTFTDLVLIANFAGDGAAANMYLRFNGDTGSNYFGGMFTGTGSAGAGSINNQSSAITTLTWTGASFNDIWGGITMHINEYKNTSVMKNVVSRGSSSNEATMGSGTWNDTSAINSIQILSFGPNYKASSIFTLYGITAA